MTDHTIHISLTELCQYTDSSTETILEFVEHGIVEPQGDSQDKWVFSVETVHLTRCAQRLHRDLGVNWAGVALALELMSQREILQQENQSLRNRLRRFLVED
jgi:chaperone modulatory protein CbpM